MTRAQATAAARLLVLVVALTGCGARAPDPTRAPATSSPASAAIPQDVLDDLAAALDAADDTAAAVEQEMSQDQEE